MRPIYFHKGCGISKYDIHSHYHSHGAGAARKKLEQSFSEMSINNVKKSKIKPLYFHM